MASRARRVPLGRRTPGPSPPPTPPQRTALGSSAALRGCPRPPIAPVFLLTTTEVSHVGCMESRRTLSQPRGGVSLPRHKYPLKPNEKTLFAHVQGLHLVG